MKGLMSAGILSVGADSPTHAQAWDKLATNGTSTTNEEVWVQVREGMSSVVLAVGPGHTLRETATKMTEKGTGAALVFDHESPAPRIITERDILNAIGTGKDPDAEKVADHMSESVISAEPTWSLEQAAEEMVQRGIRHLVVVERGELVGVLSMRDIVRCWTEVGATASIRPP
jgi:signal-transduction protein with cAMP-binding, CBS, and nucleotidyltransferase domain